MTFRNEVLEGIAAYKAMKPDPKENYYNALAKNAQQENDDYEERKKARQDAIAQGPPQLQSSIPTQSRSDTIGSGPAPAPMTDQAGNPVTNTAPTGGLRFADGGMAGDIAAGIRSTLRSPTVSYRALNTSWRNPARPQGPPVRDEVQPGGSANGATGSGGDAAGGVSGTGGVGGSASDGAGGSAAAGTSGDAGSDGSGTYRRGGRVRQGRAIRTGYRKGGVVEQGDDEEDRVEPTDEERARDTQMMDDIRAGKLKPPVYGTEEFRRRPVGPQSDQDFEPPKRRMKAFDDGGEVESWGRPAPVAPDNYGRLLTPEERERPSPSYTYSRDNPYDPGGPARR